MFAIFGIVNGLRTSYVFDFRESDTLHTAPSLFGIMKVGLAHGEPEHFHKNVIHTNLSIPYLKVLAWILGTGKGLL